MHHLTLTAPGSTTPPTDIIVGSGITKPLKKLLKSDDRTLVLFDEGVRPLAMGIADTLPNVVSIGVKSGDGSKSLAEVDRITAQMLDAGCTRRTTVVAIGGGMLTDLGGFIASIFMRGVPCILIPTTLLAVVDAAVGGKNGVNVGSRKNMVGTVTHPKAVLIDTDVLQTLPAEQFAHGLAEVIKIAAITDLPFFEWLERSLPKILQRDAAVVDECVLRAVSAKVKVVEADDHDRDVRLLLNFGHTVGHAVEALSKYALPHGDAVSIGMVAEMAITGFSESPRVLSLLTTCGLPHSIPSTMSPGDLWRIMRSDKKNEGGEVRVAVPARIGEGSVRTVTEHEFLSLFS